MFARFIEFIKQLNLGQWFVGTFLMGLCGVLTYYITPIQGDWISTEKIDLGVVETHYYGRVQHRSALFGKLDNGADYIYDFDSFITPVINKDVIVAVKIVVWEHEIEYYNCFDEMCMIARRDNCKSVGAGDSCEKERNRMQEYIDDIGILDPDEKRTRVYDFRYTGLDNFSSYRN